VPKMITFAASSIAATLVAFAFSAPSMAAGTLEQRRACTQDAFKYCGSEIPDVTRITACMVKNRKKLSPLCRAQFS
jgi:hypothetical protein